MKSEVRAQQKLNFILTRWNKYQSNNKSEDDIDKKSQKGCIKNENVYL